MHNSEAAKPSMQVSWIGCEICALKLSLAKIATVPTLGITHFTENGKSLSMQPAYCTMQIQFDTCVLCNLVSTTHPLKGDNLGSLRCCAVSVL